MNEWITERNFVLWKIEKSRSDYDEDDAVNNGKNKSDDVAENQPHFIGLSRKYLENVLRKTAGNKECSNWYCIIKKGVRGSTFTGLQNLYI